MSSIKKITKTLIILLFSVLLLFPNSASARPDYSFINAYYKPIFITIQKSLQELKQMSYEDGIIKIGEMEQTIKNAQKLAEAEAKISKKNSDDAEKEYEQLRWAISVGYKNQEKKQFPVYAEKLLNNGLHRGPCYTNKKPTTMNITAEGEWQWSNNPNDISNADGNKKNRHCSNCKFPNFPEGALIVTRTKHNSPIISSGGRFHSIEIDQYYSYDDAEEEDDPSSYPVDISFDFNNNSEYKGSGYLTLTCFVVEKDQNTDMLNTDMQLSNIILPGMIVDNREMLKSLNNIIERYKLAIKEISTLKEYLSVSPSFSDPNIILKIDKLSGLMLRLRENIPQL